MDSQYRVCDDCKHPVLASTFHEHLKSAAHREKKMESRLKCGVYLSQLPVCITREILMDELQKYGSVRSCSVNPYTGTASADFEHREAAEAFLRSPVFVLNRRIQASPRLESKQKRIIPAEPGIDCAAVIAAVEKVSRSISPDIDEQLEVVLDLITVKDSTRDHKLSSIIQDLEDHLLHLLPDCRALLFGSALVGLILKGDAIDISVCDGLQRKSILKMKDKECIKNVHKVLLDFQHKFASIEEIPDAREPMIKFVHNSTRIVCHLVANDTNGPKGSSQLRCVLDLDPRIRPVIMFIKYWAKSLNLIGNTKFSGYAITMLVCFYLQQIPEAMVPAIRLLHEKNIPEMALNITNEDPVSKLIEGFFSYYIHLILGQTVLSPYLGDVLDRATFLQQQSTPEMKIYKKMLLGGSVPLKTDTPMVLQDPYEINVNLTSRLDEKTVAEFQAFCREAFETIRNGNLLPLLKGHCAPAASSQQPPQEINTSFRAARFLQPKYLVPEPNNEVVLTKKQLFSRWLNVMFVILPDFLINFVRLQVEPQDVQAEWRVCEPRPKIPRLLEMNDAWNRSGAGNLNTTDGMTKKWLCKGRPVVCGWQQRKKAAVELELAPTLHPMEREVLISKHLEQSFQTNEVAFAFIVKVDEDKEMIRCIFENLSGKPEPFTTVAHALVILLPLWINNAFEVGFSLRCVSGVYVPGDMHIGAIQNYGTSLP